MGQTVLKWEDDRRSGGPVAPGELGALRSECRKVGLEDRLEQIRVFYSWRTNDFSKF